MTKTYCDWCDKPIENDLDLFKIDIKTSVRYHGGTTYLDCCPECFRKVAPKSILNVIPRFKPTEEEAH